MLLQVDRVSAGYRNREVLRDVSLALEAGERLLLAGPNGCGKSTLLKVIAGTLRASAGDILLQGCSIRLSSPARRVGLGLGYLPQVRNVFPSLTVGDNLRLSLLHASSSDFSVRQEWALTVFPFLRSALPRRAGLLSGGERQALAIAMATLKRPKLLLLDEPTAGLSPRAAQGILASLRRVQAEEGFACIVVEHNLLELQDWASRAVIMSQGRFVAEETDLSRLLSPEYLAKHYF